MATDLPLWSAGTVLWMNHIDAIVQCYYRNSDPAEREHNTDMK